MSFAEQFLLAVGLAMDAFSVSIYKGVKEGKFNLGLCITLGLTFGLFQGFMPILGYLLSSIPLLKNFIQLYSKYIIFLLLLLIGGNMIIESIKETIENKKKNNDSANQSNKITNNENQVNETNNNTTKTKGLCFSKEIFVLGIATSIDALSIGITFTGSNMSIIASLLASSLIAIVSFVFSFFGCSFGKILSRWIKNYAGYFGGIILILIGIKVFLGL